MYFYSIYGYEENIILVSTNKYTKEEFDRMCKEAPRVKVCDKEYFESAFIVDHLIKKYGFTNLKCTQGFCID